MCLFASKLLVNFSNLKQINALAILFKKSSKIPLALFI